MKHKLVSSLLLTAMSVALPSTAVATTWYVNGVSGSNTNNCMSPTTACKTIRHAISLALSGDTIIVAAATYTENLSIGRSLNIIGSGASTTIIDGAASHTVVTISSGANVIVSKLTIRNGSAKSGGGIYNSGTLMLIRSVVSGNIAWIPPCNFPPCFGRGGTVSGGGVYNSGTLTINNNTISGNQAVFGLCNAPPCYANGGGILNIGTLRVKNSTFTGNSTFAGYIEKCHANGGGIENSGALTVSNSTFSGNSSLVDCTNNDCSGLGGAINNVSGTLAINNVTFSGNSATVSVCTGCFAHGGGVYNASTAILQNSIVANSSSGGNCFGTMTSHGYNLSSDGTCKFNSTGDLDNTAPKLGTLGSYGGPTQTIPLLSGSPAIDAGNPNGCTDGLGHLLKTDQRGAPRPNTEDTNGCDMGAYERQSDS